MMTNDTPMLDPETLRTRTVAALEAQLVMGMSTASVTHNPEGTQILDWSWLADTVRIRLDVPLDDPWQERLLHLEAQGLADWSMRVAPVTYDAHGNEIEIPNWQDDPREDWADLRITAQGVLQLCNWYGRPYVRVQESPAVLAHWQHVQEATQGRLDALTTYGSDERRWQQEYPERYWQRLGEAQADREKWQEAPRCPTCGQWTWDMGE